MNVSEQCLQIKLLLTDVDGVLTNGGIIYSGDGTEMKIFNVKDGYICKHIKEFGIELGLITGRKSDIVLRRAKELGFKYIYQGVSRKLDAFNIILRKTSLSRNQVAYIGDDLNDLELIRMVGLAATPNDAFDYIKNEVHYVCERSGGNGAFREFADLIIKHKE